MKINKNGQAESLSRQQFQRVYSVLSLPHKLVFAMSWYTAERPGAILQLDQDNVYYPDGRVRSEILFPKATRKDRKTRLCPVHKNLLPDLKRYDRPDSIYMFTSPRDPSKHLGFSTYDKSLRKAYKMLGLEGFTPYSARRGALTLLKRSGVSSRNIQAVSGHASLASLQRYLDVDPSEVRNAIELL